MIPFMLVPQVAADKQTQVALARSNFRKSEELL
jgi:hypothetical protein